MQGALPRFTPVVKKLLIVNVAIWLVLQVIVEKFFLPQPYITHYLSLVPRLVIEDNYIWQLFSYMFLHAKDSLFHILLNMLALWFFGSELESRWGSRFFAVYYVACGVGAGVLYCIGVMIASLIWGQFGAGFDQPVLGASGAIFGILIAYGMEFGDRMVYFYGVFPMKAKVLVGVIAGFEILSLLIAGGQSNVAHTAHLGGLLVGFAILKFKNRGKGPPKGRNSRRGPKLRLVVDNKTAKESDGPRYWN